MRLVLVIFIFSLTLATASCSSKKMTKTERIIEGQRNTRLPDSLNKKWKSGIDITASGIVPVHWWLEADFDQYVSFRSEDGHDLRLLPILQRSENDQHAYYHIKTGDSALTIIMGATSCENGTLNNSAKSVSVQLGNTIYSGCGLYLYNSQLNDVWELEKINEGRVSSSDFTKGLPYIHFMLTTGDVEVSDGCGLLKGKVMVQGSRFYISGLKGFATNCKTPKISEIFSSMINNKLVDYKLEANSLLLYLIDDSKLIFKRKKF